MDSNLDWLPENAIGIFDSGVGGLSILYELHCQLPHENLIYLADTAYVPYGEKSWQQIQERTIKLCTWLFNKKIKALLIACNTATAYAITHLRALYPDRIIIGIEPGVKPAQEQSINGIIGVLATKNTIDSFKFKMLLNKLKKRKPETHFICQAGTGLVGFIEQGKIYSTTNIKLLKQYLQPMLYYNIDTLVLGCTHYHFLSKIIFNIVGMQISIINTSKAVVKHLLTQLQLRQLTQQHITSKDNIYLLTSAKAADLSFMTAQLLNFKISAQHISSDML